MCEGRGRFLGRAVLVVALIGLLGGCANIPTSGPVYQGREIGATPRAYVRIFGVPPADGSTPSEIVRGFLQAAADISDDRRVARSYLTDRVLPQWRPEASTVVFDKYSQVRLDMVDDQGRTVTEEDLDPDSGPEVTQVTVLLSVPVVARVDSSGRYELAGPQETEQRRFRLDKVEGQWRIDGLESGVLLSRTDFTDTFWDLPVYFADPTGGWLVPDVRWFPVGSSTVTTLVQAVLDGPPEWLALAVTTGAPTGTRMTQPSVPIQDGVATVDLTAEALQADPERRTMLMAQLEATLTGLPAVARMTIENVEITVESSRYDITSGPAGTRTAGQPPEPGLRLFVEPVVEDRPVVLSRGRLLRMNDGSLGEIPGVSGVDLTGTAWPAAATDGSAYAVLDGADLRYIDAGGRMTTLLRGQGPLVAPSFDPLGWVWTARSVPGGTIRATRLGQGTRSVTGRDWPTGLRVTSVRLSRDGTRALIGGERGGRAELFVCAVERDTDQVPVGFGPPLSVMPDLVEVRATAWADQRRIAVLGRHSDGTTGVWRVEVGGPAVPLGGPSGATTVTAGNGEIFAGAADSVVYRWNLESWDRVGTGAWPALPG
jgi:hypothetical protein